jgi:hypothetical protein
MGDEFVDVSAASSDRTCFHEPGPDPDPVSDPFTLLVLRLHFLPSSSMGIDAKLGFCLTGVGSIPSHSKSGPCFSKVGAVTALQTMKADSGCEGGAPGVTKNIHP